MVGREWIIEDVTVAAGLDADFSSDVVVADCHRKDTISLSLPMGCDVAHMTPGQARQIAGRLILAAEHVDDERTG